MKPVVHDPANVPGVPSMPLIRHALRTLLVLGLALPAHISLAADTRDEERDPTLPRWELGLGLVGARLADYRGSSHGRTFLLPTPYGIYRGDVLKLDRDQTRLRLFESATFSVDWSAALSFPVDSDESPLRQGMQDLQPTLEWGPQARLDLDEHWTLRTRVHLASTWEEGRLSERGIIVTPSLGWETGLGDHFTLDARLSAPFANQRNLEYYYGVGDGDVAPERPAYAAEGGFAGWDTQVSLSRRTRTSWYGVFLRNHWLQGAVMEDSPLIDDKSTWSAGIGVAWLLLQGPPRGP
jgi:outer membrane scaffolding protein for murein synthesis (MipA/OmpV family)